MAAYAEAARTAIEAAGGRFLARGYPAEVLEGNNKERIVVIEYDSVEAAKAAYDSAAYQAAMDLLGDAARRDYRIVAGA